MVERGSAVIERLQRRLLLGVLLGVIVVIGVVLLLDADSLGQALRDFDWWLLPLVLGLSLVNYALRFLKWQYYLRLLNVQGLERVDSASIFVAGFTMVMTPGKVGELLKSYLIRQRVGTPMTQTAPIIAAERITDGVAMLMLAGVGLVIFRQGWPILLASALLAGAGIAILQQESLIHRALSRLGRNRLGRGRVDGLSALYRSTRVLLRPRRFLLATGVGIVSWFGECLALFLVLVGLGVEPSARLLLAATFAFATAAWIGGLSLLPGGLGAAEASVAGLLLLTVDAPQMTPPLAGAATLLIRFATLWFGLLLGVAALARVARWPVANEPDVSHGATSAAD